MNFIAKWNKFLLNESEKPKGKSVKRLTIFDFDKTLFRSPDKPEGFKGNWWASKESLAEPHVPENPDRSYWFKDTIAAAEEAFENSKTYSVMMTGRMKKNFEDRINDLLDQNGIRFNEIHLNDTKEDTEKFKVDIIKKILKRYPTISVVEIWDDKADHIKYFIRELETDGVKVKTHKVDSVIDEARKRSMHPDPKEYEKYFKKPFKEPEVGTNIFDPQSSEKSSRMLSTTKISGYDISPGLGRSKVIKDAFENSGISIIDPDVEGIIKRIIGSIDILKHTRITHPITYGTMGELYKLSNGYVIKFFTDGYQDDVKWFKKMISLIHSGKASKYVLPFLDYGEVDLTQFSKKEIRVPQNVTKLYFVVTPHILPYSELLKQSNRDVWEADADIHAIRNAISMNYHSFAGDRKAMITRSMESLKSTGRPVVVTDNEANELIKMFIDFENNNLNSNDLHPGNIGIFHHGDKAKPTFVVIDI